MQNNKTHINTRNDKTQGKTATQKTAAHNIAAQNRITAQKKMQHIKNINNKQYTITTLTTKHTGKHNTQKKKQNNSTREKQTKNKN